MITHDTIAHNEMIHGEKSFVDYYLQFIKSKEKVQAILDKYLINRTGSTDVTAEDPLLRDFFIIKNGTYTTVYNLIKDQVNEEALVKDSGLSELKTFQKFMIVNSILFRFKFPNLEALIDTPIPPRTK